MLPAQNETYSSLHVKCPIFLSNFNHLDFLKIFS